MLSSSFLDGGGGRFHRAARDGCLDALREANRKELNSRDEDGMTPAMWAAYCGHLDALRLVVGRGGDPDKCDHYGNTCLHCASGNGHADCVSFLVNFGVNMWALDNDFRTAKDVAALNRRDDCLRMLDAAHAKHALVNKKLVQRLKEKSVYDAEKRAKSYRKLQQKAAKRAESDANKLNSTSSRTRSDDGAPKFSEIVNNTGDRKEPLAKRLSASSILERRRTKKTVVFLPGDVIRRREDEDDWGAPSAHSSDDASGSDVVLHTTADSGIGDEDSSSSPPSFGLFDRVVSSSSSFRRHSSSPMMDVGLFVPASSPRRHSSNLKDSIGSAGSLARRHITWEDECEEVEDADDDATDVSEDDDDEEEDEDEDEDCGGGPLSVLLAVVGLSDYLPLFESERIDLEALTLLSEEDLKTLGMPLGPRRKLDRAVRERTKTMRDPGAVRDSQL